MTDQRLHRDEQDLRDLVDAGQLAARIRRGGRLVYRVRGPISGDPVVAHQEAQDAQHERYYGGNHE